jgi:hypothetical protein
MGAFGTTGLNFSAGPGVQMLRGRLREKSNFASGFKLIWVVQSGCEKYSACSVGQIRRTHSAVPRCEEGASRSSRNVVRDAMDAGTSTDE